MFWLSGWAGTGNSTIARIVQSPANNHDKGRLRAIFFASFVFSRESESESESESDSSLETAQPLFGIQPNKPRRPAGRRTEART